MPTPLLHELSKPTHRAIVTRRGFVIQNVKSAFAEPPGRLATTLLPALRLQSKTNMFKDFCRSTSMDSNPSASWALNAGVWTPPVPA